MAMTDGGNLGLKQLYSPMFVNGSYQTAYNNTKALNINTNKSFNAQAGSCVDCLMMKTGVWTFCCTCWAII